MQKLTSGMRRKHNFEVVFGFKSDTAVLAFTFAFSSLLLLLFFLLLMPRSFSLAGHLIKLNAQQEKNFSRLNFGGKS